MGVERLQVQGARDVAVSRGHDRRDERRDARGLLAEAELGLRRVQDQDLLVSTRQIPQLLHEGDQLDRIIHQIAFPIDLNCVDVKRRDGSVVYALVHHLPKRRSGRGRQRRGPPAVGHCPARHGPQARHAAFFDNQLALDRLCVPLQHHQRAALSLDVAVGLLVESEAPANGVHKLVVHRPPVPAQVHGDAPSEPSCGEWFPEVVAREQVVATLVDRSQGSSSLEVDGEARAHEPQGKADAVRSDRRTVGAGGGAGLVLDLVPIASGVALVDADEGLQELLLNVTGHVQGLVGMLQRQPLRGVCDLRLHDRHAEEFVVEHIDTLDERRVIDVGADAAPAQLLVHPAHRIGIVLLPVVPPRDRDLRGEVHADGEGTYVLTRPLAAVGHVGRDAPDHDLGALRDCVAGQHLPRPRDLHVLQAAGRRLLSVFDQLEP
mmetsp:Transcript_47352/g.144021  ORF Transcript_47352/g.144021 Transcript_47352/m.144021 type:complete len:434 (-) Transcript_47352:753-2054(-)